MTDHDSYSMCQAAATFEGVGLPWATERLVVLPIDPSGVDPAPIPEEQVGAVDSDQAPNLSGGEGWGNASQAYLSARLPGQLNARLVGVTGYTGEGGQAVYRLGEDLNGRVPYGVWHRDPMAPHGMRLAGIQLLPPDSGPPPVLYWYGHVDCGNNPESVNVELRRCADGDAVWVADGTCPRCRHVVSETFDWAAFDSRGEMRCGCQLWHEGRPDNLGGGCGATWNVTLPGKPVRRPDPVDSEFRTDPVDHLPVARFGLSESGRRAEDPAPSGVVSGTPRRLGDPDPSRLHAGDVTEGASDADWAGMPSAGLPLKRGRVTSSDVVTVVAGFALGFGTAAWFM